nr:TIGR02452 family protein [Ligilactobacillus ruminis]
MTEKELLAIHEKRARRILDVAVSEGNEIVILGAFGCGAFKNKTEIVARAYKNVIADYLHAFKTIEFAVYCTPKDDSNYRAFERIMRVYE